MNKEKLFNYLKHQKPSELIKLLNACYCHMKTNEIRSVFEHIENKFLAKSPSDGKDVLKLVQKFITASLSGDYYAPFAINSKNFMNVPEETDMWFEKLSELLTESSRLSQQGDHINAVKCFSALYELIDKMSFDEIVFADELGMWMLPIKEEPCIKAYFESAAAILEPEAYVKAVLPIIRNDNLYSCANKAYKHAKCAANKQQKILLAEKIGPGNNSKH